MKDPKKVMTVEFNTTIVLSNLLDEIKDKSLENIFRQLIFHDDNNIKEGDAARIIREQRPEIKYI